MHGQRFGKQVASRHRPVRLAGAEFVSLHGNERFVRESFGGVAICFLAHARTCVYYTGNISSLHWYHRQRVTEENRKPFGKLVGLGTLTIGVAIILFGILFWIYEVALMEWLIIMGSIILGVGIIAGLCLSFYAMIKYNKGVF